MHVMHAITTHTVHTRNAEPLAIPNSKPLCLGLLPWNVLSVQLPPSQIYVCFIPTYFLMLRAGISSRKRFMIPPIPTQSLLRPFLGYPFLGILGLPSGNIEL